MMDGSMMHGMHHHVTSHQYTHNHPPISPVSPHTPTSPHLPKQKLFVGNMPLSATESGLHEIASYFGHVVEVVLLRRPSPDGYRCGFVCFADPETASRAMDGMSKMSYPEGDTTMLVRYAEKQRTPRGSMPTTQMNGAPGARYGGTSPHMPPGGAPPHYTVPPALMHSAHGSLTPTGSWHGAGQAPGASHGLPSSHAPMHTHAVSAPASGNHMRPLPSPHSGMGGFGADPGKVFVGNLPPNANEHSVRDLFAAFGDIIEVVMMRKQSLSGCKCAFVRFAHPGSAAAAISGLHNAPTGDSRQPPLLVRIADPPKTPTSSGPLSPSSPPLTPHYTPASPPTSPPHSPSNPYAPPFPTQAAPQHQHWPAHAPPHAPHPGQLTPTQPMHHGWPTSAHPHQTHQALPSPHQPISPGYHQHPQVAPPPYQAPPGYSVPGHPHSGHISPHPVEYQQHLYHQHHAAGHNMMPQQHEINMYAHSVDRADVDEVSDLFPPTPPVVLKTPPVPPAARRLAGGEDIRQNIAPAGHASEAAISPTSSEVFQHDPYSPAVLTRGPNAAPAPIGHGR